MTPKLVEALAFSLALYVLCYFFLGWFGVIAVALVGTVIGITCGGLD